MIDPDKAVTYKLQSQFIYILCYMGSMITYCIGVAFKRFEQVLMYVCQFRLLFTIFALIHKLWGQIAPRIAPEFWPLGAIAPAWGL